MCAKKSPTDRSLSLISQIKNPASASPFRQNPMIWRSASCFRPATRRRSGCQHRRPSIRCAGDRPCPQTTTLQAM